MRTDIEELIARYHAAYEAANGYPKRPAVTYRNGYFDTGTKKVRASELELFATHLEARAARIEASKSTRRHHVTVAAIVLVTFAVDGCEDDIAAIEAAKAKLESEGPIGKWQPAAAGEIREAGKAAMVSAEYEEPEGFFVIDADEAGDTPRHYNEKLRLDPHG